MKSRESSIRRNEHKIKNTEKQCIRTKLKPNEGWDREKKRSKGNVRTRRGWGSNNKKNMCENTYKQWTLSKTIPHLIVELSKKMPTDFGCPLAHSQSLPQPANVSLFLTCNECTVFEKTNALIVTISDRMILTSLLLKTIKIYNFAIVD